MKTRFPRRILLSAAVVLAFAATFSVTVQAQNVLRNSEASISVFAQFSSNSNGNGIQDSPTNSAGGQAAFRHSYHWWLGYEGSYNYTRFAERYSGQPFSYQHNTHDFAASYLVTTPAAILGFRPFVEAGISALVFSPSLNGGQNVTWQGKPALNYSVGIDHALLSEHFGVRVQYRGLYYKTPDFGRAALTTGASRTTSEPMAGVYVRF